MEIIFKSKDGKIFNSVEDCVKHEASLGNRTKDWQAWDYRGEQTNRTDNAILVKLSTKDAAAQFLTAADLYEDNIEGIGVEDEGWFLYDEYSEKYILIDDIFIDIFKNISAS